MRPEGQGNEGADPRTWRQKGHLTEGPWYPPPRSQPRKDQLLAVLSDQGHSSLVQPTAYECTQAWSSRPKAGRA